jgi:hypothetical protein
LALTRDLQVVRASTATLKKDLEATQAFATATNSELSSKSAAFNELAVWERDARNKLQALGNEKKTQDTCWSPVGRCFPSETILHRR